jgi:hypothetical protein
MYVWFITFQGEDMKASLRNRVVAATVAAVVVAGLIGLMRMQPAHAARDDAAPVTGPRYSVVESEAHNLIVTDNKSNTLYFYTIDKEKEVGSELKLRGSIDLNQVGKSTIMPNKAAGQ